MFFVSIVGFGIWVILTIRGIQHETANLIKALVGQANTQFEWIFLGAQVGFGIGTTSFLFVNILWFVLWWSISNERRENLLNPILLMPPAESDLEGNTETLGKNNNVQ